MSSEYDMPYVATGSMIVFDAENTTTGSMGNAMTYCVTVKIFNYAKNRTKNRTHPFQYMKTYPLPPQMTIIAC